MAACEYMYFRGLMLHFTTSQKPPIACRWPKKGIIGFHDHSGN